MQAGHETDPRRRGSGLRAAFAELSEPTRWALEAWPLVRDQVALLSESWKKAEGPRFVPQGSYWLAALEACGAPSWAVAEAMGRLLTLHDLSRHEGRGTEVCYHAKPGVLISSTCHECRQRWTCVDCGEPWAWHPQCEAEPFEDEPRPKRREISGPQPMTIIG